MRTTLVALCLALPTLLTGCAGSVPAPAPVAPAAKLPTREEFKSMVMGKTPDEVIAAVGRPNSTSEDTTSDRSLWHYHSFVIDPITGNAGLSTQVVFEGGKVVKINF